MTLKLIQLAQMTPAQHAWCTTADDTHRQAFILGGEIKVLAGLGRDHAPAFAPVVHGVRVQLDDQPTSHPTAWEALEAGERLKKELRADLTARGVTVPELDLDSLGLQDAFDEEEATVEDEQDLVLALLSFQDLELLKPPVLSRPSLAFDEKRVNVMPALLSGAAGLKTVRAAPDAGQVERLNPYARQAE